LIGAGTRIAAAGVLALLLPFASACMGPGDFRCTEHAQCTIGTTPGTCEANGHCSLPAKDCAPSYRRYAHHAGSDADTCVPATCADNPITQVSAGGGHACLVRRADHSLWCWGRNDRGQIGDGTRTPRAQPVRVAAIEEVAAVAAGDLHTCAITTGAAVFCWGAGDSGQLGDLGRNDRGLPQLVAGVTGLTGVPGTIALAAGRDFSCALGADHAVRCWGDDSLGQLGDGGAPGPYLPAVVPGLSAKVAKLSAQWQHACALDTAGTLACWGANSSGQIGDGLTSGARPPTTPSAPLPAQVTAVATGRDHTCALAADGVYCWGANAQGQVNPAQPSMPIPTPQAVTGSSDVTDPKDIAAGGQHTCIVRQGEKNPITCWGANTSGQLGDGTPMDDATIVAAGAAFSCGLGKDDALYCWGDNHYGQLAIGGDTVRPTAAPVPGLAHVGALAAGGAHNCATADDANGARALFCWGANGSSQLGDLSSTDAPAVARIATLQPVAIAAGRAHTCAFGADKELRCWGSGASGQLGQPPGNDMVITSPTITDLGGPEGGDGVYAVAAGASHTCVGATISASVLCFGLNGDGQLGNGMQGLAGGPDPVPSLLGKPKMLAAGDAHTCALDAGTIWCWGRGDEGQLGDGMGVEHAKPTAVDLDNDATAADAVVAGAAHTCALAGGRIICWGRNTDGQVGAPLQMPLLNPTPVNTIWQAVAVAAGARHTCAIDGNATVSCWGANESGELGNGTFDSSNVPVPVTGLTNVDAIVAGGSHSCARRTDGTVWCWGANTSGQLGDGVTLSSPSPLVARIACP
jgi:alpha-tubulin suppressor-like RCC1 family protein